MKNKLFALLACLITLGAVRAQNPLITHMYTADPTARVHDGKLYLYPSSDMVPPEGSKIERFCMPGYHAFSSENLYSWKDHGWVLKENDVPWGTRDTYAMWAPDCVEKDGKYYYFYPAGPADKSAFRRIGVGVSKNPAGPFKWEDTYIDGVSGIDPGVLVDDDNKAYLFFGGGHELYVAPLADDMKSITQKAIKVESLPAGYKEAAFPIKIDSTYYLTFAHVFADEGYTIGYATSDKPMGPYTYRGKMMDNIENGTNHHSIVKYKGNWILFYHSWQISGSKYLRSACADYLRFKKDGTVYKVKPTLRGIGTPTLRDTIQIDRYNEISGAQVAFVSGDEPNGWMICEARPAAYVRFNKVDFGDGKAKKAQIRMASGQRTGRVELRIGNPKSGAVVASWDISYTGGWSKWVTKDAEIKTAVKGVKDVFLVFHTNHGDTKTANVNWVILE